MLGIFALIGACSMANANTLFINNTTNCTYDISIGGIGGSGGALNVAVPGMSSATSAPPSSGIFGVKIAFPNVTGGNTGTYVGDTVPFASTAGMPAPICFTPFGYITAIWQTAPNGDVTLTIL